MLPHIIPLPAEISPSDMDCTLALDKPYDLGHRILRWDREHHMHMILQQVAFFYLTLLLSCQTLEDFS